MGIIDFLRRKEQKEAIEDVVTSSFSLEEKKQICDFGYWMNQLTQYEFSNPETISDSKLKDIQDSYLSILCEANILPNRTVELQRMPGETKRYKIEIASEEIVIVLNDNTIPISLTVLQSNETKQYFYNKETGELKLEGIVLKCEDDLHFDQTITEDTIEFELTGKENSLQITLNFPTSLQEKVTDFSVANYIRNLTFPLDIVAVYNQLCQMIGSSFYSFFSVEIEYSTYVEEENVSSWKVTDLIRLEKGEFVGFVTTKKGRTLAINDFSSWTKSEQELLFVSSDEKVLEENTRTFS